MSTSAMRMGWPGPLPHRSPERPPLELHRPPPPPPQRAARLVAQLAAQRAAQLEQARLHSITQGDKAAVIAMLTPHNPPIEELDALVAGPGEVPRLHSDVPIHIMSISMALAFTAFSIF